MSPEQTSPQPASAPSVPLRLSVLDGRLSVCKLPADAEIPAWATGSSFFSVTRTPDELSVVCPQENVPAGVAGEGGWRALRLDGTFDFGLVGVLASVAAPLAESEVSILAVATHDTDYVLVPEPQLGSAVGALRDRGLEVRGAGIVVRPGLPDDEPFLWEMLYEAVHQEPGDAGPKPPPEELLSVPGLRRYVEGWGRPGDVAVVAASAGDGGRVGAAWFRLFPASAPGYGFVGAGVPEIAIAVAPGRRGSGVGGALLRALMDVARSGGFDALSLSVQKSNHAAAGLYERNGFVGVRDDGDARVMKAGLHAGDKTDGATAAPCGPQRTEKT